MNIDNIPSEDNEEDDILDFLELKGRALDAFKHEYLELQKETDVVLASNVGKEREVEYLTSELKMVREQLTFGRRNVDELMSQQEVLKETIESITIQKESLKEQELANREEINVYTGYFDDLKEALAVGVDWSPEQLEQKAVLEKERDFIASKLENKSNMLNSIRDDAERIFQYIQKLEEDSKDLDKKMHEIDGKRSDMKKQSNTLLKEKDSTEKNILEVRESIVELEAIMNEKSRVLKSDEKALKTLEGSIAKSKNKMEDYIVQYEEMYRKLQESTSELEKQKSYNQKMDAEIQEIMNYIEEKTKDTEKLQKEIKKVQQLRELTLQKIKEAEDIKHSAESKMDELNKQMQMIREVDMVNTRKDIDSLIKQSSQLKLQLEIIRKKHVGSERTAKAMLDLIQLNKNGKVNLTLEKKVLEEEIEHQKNQIRTMLSEKERFEHDAEVANQQYYTALEELKLQELQIQELNKKIINDQRKLKQKQSLYESVRSDRNLYSKQLIDSQDEINELKRKFRSMNHQIDQMKEEISSKDHAIVKEHFLHHSVDKERELLKNEIMKIKKQVQSSEVIIDNQRIEIMKLQRIIEEADQEANRQKNELGNVLSERNLLTGQLVRRNYELGEMYEKIKIQRSNLRIGEQSYMKFMDNLLSWQRQLRDMVLNHNEAVQGLHQIDEYRTRIVQLERDIRKEMIKSRALQDELEVPMNVHRWRILESSDPKRFEKIMQIQNLQKHLVTMSDDVIRHELLITEKEKIYIELKNVIARQPGPEVEEQILMYQQTLKDKGKQLIAMDQELEMYIEQVGVFKEEITKIDQQQLKLSKKWIKTRKSHGLHE